MNGVMWKGVSVALMVLFYWGCDLLFHGRTWGIVDVSMAIAAVWIAPLIWRWQEKRDKLASIRDERAIRTELLLREILKKQEENS
jgi:membrane protein YdbS with pleckstrin-like domain